MMRTSSTNFSVDEIEYYSPSIELIRQRFRYTVTDTDILRWLANFNPTDRASALTVLQHADYVSEIQIVEAFETCLRSVLNEVSSGHKITVLGLGDKFGKSGTAMIYYLRKTPCYKQFAWRFKLIAQPKQLKRHLNENTVILLVDDFLGSGTSALTYYKHYIEQQTQKLAFVPTCFIISAFAMPRRSAFVTERATQL